MSSAVELLAGLVLDDGRRWGDAAEPFQWADARAVLDTSAEAPRLHFQTRPRGGSKTTDEAGIGVVALIEQAPPRMRGYALAVDQDQAGLLVDAAAGFVQRTQLSGVIEVQARRLVNRRSGASIDILPADAASAFGIRPWAVFVDELAQWGATANPRRLWAAAVSSVPKVAGCRLVVTTSAGDPGHWSHRVLERAKVSPRWRVSETPGPVPWIDEGDLAEQRVLLTESQYARLHLNRWTSPEDRLTTVDDLRACVDPSLDPEAPRSVRGSCSYAIGVDLGLKNDRTVVAVCSVDVSRDRAPVVLERMAVWSGSRSAPVDLDVIESWVLAAWREFGWPPVIFDPYQAAQLMGRLSKSGVGVREFVFSQTSVGRLAQRLYQLIRDHQLRLPDDEELLDELANVRLRETSPGVVRLDHDPDKHDDRAIALALAAQHLVDAPSWGDWSAASHAGAPSIMGDLFGAGF